IPSAKKELKISLKTKCRTTAMIAAREHKVMFDCLFTEIRESVARMASMRETFQELDESTQRELMLKQRATEAINDQQFTQQLFFLLERKNRIKTVFKNIDQLQDYSLADMDLSSIDKINRFIAIIDLLSSPTLADPQPYIDQLNIKPRAKTSSNDGSSYKSVGIARMVVKRNKPKPLPETPTQLTKQSKASRNSANDTIVGLIDTEIKTGQSPTLRSNTASNTTDDIILEGITLDNEQDTHNFVKLLSLLEKGENVPLQEFEAFSKPVIVPKTMLKVSELFQKFYDEQNAEWKSHKTHTTNLAFYDTFVEIVGDVFVDELSFEHANQYIDTLRKLPPNRKKLKAFKDKSIEELIAMQGTFEPMSASNVNKNLERLKSVFLWAVQRRYMTVNILDKMRVKNRAQKVQAKKQRERFTQDELITIFNSDKYQNGKHNRTYEYWLPLLGLYMGARLGELSQLRLQDVYREEGTWLVDFNEDEDKTLKTINSIRKVPVHKVLVRLGFIRYVEHLKALYKADKLHTNLIFPDLIKGRDGYGHNTAKSFDRYLKALDIKADGKSFHSLRHTFADERKQADENPAMTAELMGHEIDNETLGRYGKEYKITLKKAQIDHYEPLTETQIKKILPFKLWKEFALGSTMSKSANAVVDMKKSITSNKHLHKALAEPLGITPPVEVPRKPRKTATSA
ncbi:TPA: site-specific integrase, partial [Vibrio parahaemolyticus]